MTKLPCFKWQLLEDYSHAEVAFTRLNFESRAQAAISRKKLRILAVLGDATGIDVERDRAFFSKPYIS